MNPPSKFAKLNKTGVVIILLAALLVLSVGYIAFDKYQDEKQKEQLTAFQQGAQYGYEQAVIQLANQASTCQQVALKLGNQTLNIVAVDCLQADTKK